MDNKTIYALSTGYGGKSGVAVVRISGDDAVSGRTEKGQNLPADLKPRYAYFSALRHPVTRETLDHALVLYFKAPHSFTGEDVVEFQIHGRVPL